ncbi:MAG: ferrous iron transport protein A [Candidatus Cloacimonetes bacterium]|jgi:Fe2+ transport system protein FeoA|nr:ferrous iron transport protein A [Candidatus Cloacimonadota bacterium]MBT7470337.1 ferrous iron transport protein A [Candidatus Cloacimonadota bacterium]
MFGFGKNKKCCENKHRRGGSRGERKFRNCITLAEATENQKYIVRLNPDKQTMEMGIASGSLIFVHKNDVNETNLIVGVGETRLIIPRQSAQEIRVK